MYSDQKEFFGSNSSSTGWPLWLEVAVGVALGVLVANGIEWGVANYYFATALSQATAQMRQSTEKMQTDLARSTAQAADREDERRRQLASVEAERIRALADQQHLQEMMRSAAAAQADRREQAWRKFYTPSPGCAGSVASVECGNEHMRAKRDFEERFAAGRL